MLSISQIFTIFGGLAIFIFGMQLMSDGLQNAAGQKMRSLLRLFAKNSFVAVGTGAAVTSIVQSSSATTVMTVGFVNAGLLTLQQAIGITLGSHIGTTITGQLVAFKISWIIMPAIIAGLILNFFTKRSISSWGTTLMGFGFLFLGMEFMGNELHLLSTSEAVTSIFRTFKCEPVNGIMPATATAGAIFIGILVTVIIQSSSATSGIVIVLAGSGLLDLYTATAIVLGSNIGTTITAQLAALTANRVAKQAALSHTLTSTVGVVLTVLTFWITAHGEPVFFYLVKLCSPGALIGREVANANTIFNIVTTLIFIPAVPLIAKICEKIIPVDRSTVKFKRLEPHLLATPSIALAQTSAALRKMLIKAWKMIDCALNIYGHNDEANQHVAKQLEKREADVDSRQQEIADYLSELMQRPLTHEQTKQIPLLLHCTNDTERIGDHTFIIKGIFDRMTEENLKFSPEAEKELDELHDNLSELAKSVIRLLEKKFPETAADARNKRGVMVEKLAKSESEHLRRIANGQCVPEVGIMYLELLDEMRKITRHLANITDRADNFYDKLDKLGKLPLVHPAH